MSTTTTEVKPGWKSTEFWLCVVAIVVSALLASGLIAPDSQAARVIGAIGTILSSLGYSASRAKVKVAHALGGVEVVEDEPAPAPAAAAADPEKK